MVRIPKLVRPSLLAVLLAGCAQGVNYPSPVGPRYAGTAPSAARPAPDALRVVTFNIQFARHVDRAITLFASTPALRDADVVALQEMDAPGTRRIAEALGMSWVYYPATVHPKTGRDFGDAILSRWPIVADQKIPLPHRARFDGTARIATAATILVGTVPVRVYSVHLGTFADVGAVAKRDQVRAVVADAARYPHVVIAGDMNSHDIGETFRESGYRWPTEHDPATTKWFDWDHVFLKGLAPAGVPSTGVVPDARGASDHRPVWAVVRLSREGARSAEGSRRSSSQ